MVESVEYTFRLYKIFALSYIFLTIVACAISANEYGALPGIFLGIIYSLVITPVLAIPLILFESYTDETE